MTEPAIVNFPVQLSNGAQIELVCGDRFCPIVIGNRMPRCLWKVFAARLEGSRDVRIQGLSPNMTGALRAVVGPTGDRLRPQARPSHVVRPR